MPTTNTTFKDEPWYKLKVRIIESPLFRQNNIKHGFFTRKGGVSKGIYESLNFGFNSGDSLANILDNYQLASKFLGVPNIVTVKQIHSNIAVLCDKPWSVDQRPEADAIVTKNSNIAIGALSADCVPVLLYDPINKVSAAAHAGWQGALSGIVKNTIDLMEEVGGKREHIIAAIMPSIAQESYEVDIDFRQRFIGQSVDNEKFFTAGKTDGKYQFALKFYVKQKLEEEKIAKIDMVEIDTFADVENCFSYRRATKNGENSMGIHLSFIIS
jgi:YfiH family protein